MENSYLAPWTLSSNSSCGRTANLVEADQRFPKRRRTQAHVSDPGGLQITYRQETSTTSVGIAKSPARGQLSNSIGFSDRTSVGFIEEHVEDKDTQAVQQSVGSILEKDVVGDSEQHEMDPGTISRLMEMADSDPRLEHLVEVLHSGKASVLEKEEWKRYCNSLSSSAGLLEPEQAKKYVAPVMEPQKPPKVTLMLSEPFRGQPSNATSVHSSGSVGKKLSPPCNLTGHQHDKTPTESPKEDDVVFLHERSWTLPNRTGTLHEPVIANASLVVAPATSFVVEKSGTVPVADPFAQAKRKRAQAEAELKRGQETSDNIDTVEVESGGRTIVPTTTSSVRGGSTSVRILSVKVQNLEDSIAEYQAELQRKNTMLQTLSDEVDRERTELRLSLKKSTQQVADLRIELKESQRAMKVAQTKYRELRLKMERIPKPVSGNAPTTQDITDIELSNLRGEVSALRNLLAAKDKSYPNYDFVHRNLYLAPLVMCGRPKTVSVGRGRPPKSTPSNTESDTGMNISAHNEEYTDEAENYDMTKNERALRAFDKALGLPQNPIPVRIDGMLAYRDGTRDANGRLPRAKQLFKVGRNVPGELK
ncbi:hypothetical protein MMC26_003233 [Xylographa opegraphella]|nr:hypothetical protein [Xylographa opegraphella]